ncbi:MAG: amidohydrolase family protein, partial [Actinobacteria bacterium]|nr:amidohydrolase family protein [Actinomycetota bacterium]
MHDLVIRNGTLVDGSGGPSHRSDVAVTGDKVTEVGEVAGKGRREIDADGAIVTPGWVDIHTHYDGQATWDPEVTPSSWHGVTTVVMGNCGVGFAPVVPDRKEFLIQLMEGVEDIPGTALADGVTWNWETFPEYLNELACMPRVLDVSALIPHGAVRAYVMGDEAAVHRDEATGDEIALMTKLVREGLEAGAVGFSTSRTLLHRAKDGELAAGTNATFEELVTIGSALADAGHGVFEVASDLIDIDAEFSWMEQISRESGCPVSFGCLQGNSQPDAWQDYLAATDAANARGANLIPQVAGRPACLLFGLEATAHPFMFHRTYRALAALPLAERVAKMRDPDVRAAMIGEDPLEAGLARLVTADLDRLFPLGDPPDYEPTADQSIAAIAQRQGRSAVEVAYDALLERDGHALLYKPILGYAHGNFDDLLTMINRPGTVLGLGDAGAHCGLLCDASLPTYMLSHWVRDRTRGERLSLEHAVHLQTRRTAEVFGFFDRGLVAPGMLADLNVLDFDSLGIPAPEMTYDLPTGAPRFIQRSTGYVATVKSGV